MTRSAGEGFLKSSTTGKGLNMARIIRKFTEMVGLLSRGDFAKHLDGQLTEALDALEQCPADKCKAEITVKISLDYELGRIDIKAESKVKLPETVRFMKTPFWGVDGALSVEHPSQIDMFPRGVRDEPEEDAVTA